MKQTRFYRLSGWLALCLMASACTLTPGPENPVLVSDIQRADTFQERLSPSLEPSSDVRWWLMIGGEELDGLVISLQQESLVLREGRLQVQQAREGVLAARGQRLPAVSAFTDVSVDRAPDITGAYSWSESYTLGSAIDFNADIFGGLRASARAAELSAHASELTLKATEQREIATLTKSWVSAVTLQRRLDLAKRNAVSFKATYDLTNERYGAGSSSVSASDVQIARQNLETALVDILEFETELNKQLYLIDEQIGRLPGETSASFVGSLNPITSANAPVGRPASMLANRPDVAAAELRYLAALEDVGTARANLYPGLSLSASLTFQSDSPGELFDWDRHIASLANSLTAPLFQGGTLKAQVRSQEARAEELATAFARTALAAVTDVELALTEISGLEAQRVQLQAALETARLSNELAQGRYGQGSASILSVLETQRSLNASEQNLVLTDQAIANAHVDLFLSLGGDWNEIDERRTDDPQS